MKTSSLAFMVAFCFSAFLGFSTSVQAKKEVCYGKYGCFNNKPPFNRGFLYNSLPGPPSEMGTTFYLYTRKDAVGFTVLDDNDATKLEESDYDGTKRSILITHGWTGSPLESSWVNDMKQAFLDKEDVNVIVVGWKEGAGTLNYPQAVANSRLVGAQVAQFVKFLNDETGNSPDSFHLVGFSLGAHVSGYAGDRIQDLSNNQTIARITGLDPASPGYSGFPTDVRLDSTDGAFVDVIHTSTTSLGIPDESGHFDFRPNGGETQPGCSVEEKKKRAKITKKRNNSETKSSKKSSGCDHNRAPPLFIESIRASSPAFVSYRCDSVENFKRAECTSCADGCPEMGYNAVKYKDSPAGNFYLVTFGQSPFRAMRYVKITFETDDGANGDNPTVVLYGADIDSGEIQITADLEAGSTESFVAPLKRDPGPLERIAVKNDQGTGNGRWKVIRITVKYLDDDTTCTACYNMAVEGDFVEKPLTSGETTCKRKHTIRNHLKKFRKTGHKKDAKKSKKIH